MELERNNPNKLICTSDMIPESGEGYTRICLFKDDFQEYTLSSITYDESRNVKERTLFSFDQDTADSLQLALFYSLMNEQQAENFNKVTGLEYCCEKH